MHHQRVAFRQHHGAVSPCNPANHRLPLATTTLSPVGAGIATGGTSPLRRLTFLSRQLLATLFVPVHLGCDILHASSDDLSKLGRSWRRQRQNDACGMATDGTRVGTSLLLAARRTTRPISHPILLDSSTGHRFVGVADFSRRTRGWSPGSTQKTRLIPVPGNWVLLTGCC